MRLPRLPERPPIDPGRFRSPLRGPWLTSVFGAVLLVGLPVVILTGLLSYIAYQPQYGQAFPRSVGWLHLPFFAWPASPSWLYRLNQGLHVALGLALIPVVLAKLWSVLPKLFDWPPVRSVAHALERLSLLLLVGSILFELITGVLNIQYEYVFRFDFYTAHYYGAWIFIVSFVAHVGLKLPTMVRALRSRSMRAELRTSRADTIAEPPDPDHLVTPNPAEPTMSRRGALGLVGGAAVLLTAVSVGETAGDGLRPTALLSPRGRSYGSGPQDFQVNRTARTAGITPAVVGADWQLSLRGPGAATRSLSRADLQAMTQHTRTLPIACVEGWSTTQRWTGVPIADLAALLGLTGPHTVHVRSLERHGAFNAATLNPDQTAAGLLALQANGADLSLDHGFPARVIVPAMPGVHNTKWVASLEFARAAR